MTYPPIISPTELARGFGPLPVNFQSELKRQKATTLLVGLNCEYCIRIRTEKGEIVGRIELVAKVTEAVQINARRIESVVLKIIIYDPLFGRITGVETTTLRNAESDIRAQEWLQSCKRAHLFPIQYADSYQPALLFPPSPALPLPSATGDLDKDLESYNDENLFRTTIAICSTASCQALSDSITPIQLRAMQLLAETRKRWRSRWVIQPEHVFIPAPLHGQLMKRVVRGRPGECHFAALLQMVADFLIYLGTNEEIVLCLDAPQPGISYGLYKQAIWSNIQSILSYFASTSDPMLLDVESLQRLMLRFASFSPTVEKTASIMLEWQDVIDICRDLIHNYCGLSLYFNIWTTETGIPASEQARKFFRGNTVLPFTELLRASYDNCIPAAQDRLRNPCTAMFFSVKLRTPGNVCPSSSICLFPPTLQQNEEAPFLHLDTHHYLKAFCLLEESEEKGNHYCVAVFNEEEGEFHVYDNLNRGDDYTYKIEGLFSLLCLLWENRTKSVSSLKELITQERRSHPLLDRFLNHHDFFRDIVYAVLYLREGTILREASRPAAGQEEAAPKPSPFFALKFSGLDIANPSTQQRVPEQKPIEPPPPPPPTPPPTPEEAGERAKRAQELFQELKKRPCMAHLISGRKRELIARAYAIITVNDAWKMFDRTPPTEDASPCRELDFYYDKGTLYDQYVIRLISRNARGNEDCAGEELSSLLKDMLYVHKHSLDELPELYCRRSVIYY